MALKCLLKLVLFCIVGYYAIFKILPCCSKYLGCSRDVKPPPALLGPLTRNKILDSAVRIYKDKVGLGPESLAVHNGVMYTGCQDGRIFKLKSGKVEVLTKIGVPDCIPLAPSGDEAKRCGYPLGMRFDKAGNLIVADLIKGLYQVDVNTGVVKYLVSYDTEIDYEELNAANDLDIAKTGEIYFSEVSTTFKYDVTPLWLEYLNSKPEGRILVYNPQTKKTSTLIDHIHLANGIQLSPDEDFLLISQPSQFNILKYYLKGPKQGQLEVFLDNLPGYPDNIRPSGRGTYWLGLYTPRIRDEPTLWDKLNCKLLQIGVFGSLEILAQGLNLLKSLLPYSMFDAMHHSVQSFIINNTGNREYGLVIEFNMKGEIIRSLHSPNGIVNQISQVTETDGNLYFTSPMNTFIGRLKLP